jgi:hypothetical protein
MNAAPVRPRAGAVSLIDRNALSQARFFERSLPEKPLG